MKAWGISLYFYIRTFYCSKMWLLFAILSGFFFAALALVDRHLLKEKESDPLAFSFFFSFTSTLLLIPVVFYDPQFSSDILPWVLVIIVSALLSAGNFLNYIGVKHASASTVGTIRKFKVVWVFLLGLLLAYEEWSVYKGLGVLFTLIAGIIVVAKSDEPLSLKGCVYTFIATFFAAAAFVIYTPLLQDFNVLSLTFLIFAFPALINFMAMKNVIVRIKAKYNKQSWRLLVIGLLGVLANITFVAAVNLGETTRVLVIVEALFIVVLLGEHFILKDKKGILRKSAAAILAIMGAILIRIAS